MIYTIKKSNIKMDYVIIINEKNEDMEKIIKNYQNKSVTLECKNIIDLYNQIKKEKKITKDSDILIINTNKLDKENTSKYKNLLNFYLFYKEEVIKIEKEMIKYNKTFINKNDNKLVKDAMKEFTILNSNGKYVRALLIALGYFISSKEETDYYLPLAAAYETFRTSILIHDDVIDNAIMRRGNKTVHKIYEEKFNKYKTKTKYFKERNKSTSNSVGICLGDIGFYISNNIIVENYQKNPNLPRLLKLYNDIVINTGKGELIDVILPFNEQYNSHNKCEEKDIMEIYNLKTSWYTIVGPCALGLVLGGANQKIVDSISETLSNIGIAFQIKDDILGIYGSAKNLGKSNTSDISEYKQTILYSYTIKKNEYKKELKKYYGKEKLTEKELNKVRNIFEESGAKKYAINKMNTLFNNSKKLILNNKNIKDNYKEILLGLITFLEIREK